MGERSDKLYKSVDGRKEESLNSTNYEEWALIMQRSLDTASKWGYVDNTIRTPELPGDEDSAEDRTAKEDVMEEYVKKRKATSRLIMNGVTDAILSTYLYDVNTSRPDLIWDTLQKSLGGANEEKSAELLTKFTKTKWEEGVKYREFSIKLKKMQALINFKQPMKQANGINGTAQTENSICSVSDTMVIQRLLDNRHPNWVAICDAININREGLSIDAIVAKLELHENKLRKLEDLEVEVVKPMGAPAAFAAERGDMYMRTPERFNNYGNQYEGFQYQPTQHRQQNYTPPNQMNGPHVFQSPDLPCPPGDWRGNGCWWHQSGNHQVSQCENLKMLQWNANSKNGADPTRAAPKYGYPSPTSIPQRIQRGNDGSPGRSRNNYNNRNNQSYGTVSYTI